jgi:hypothetical protein
MNKVRQVQMLAQIRQRVEDSKQARLHADTPQRALASGPRKSATSSMQYGVRAFIASAPGYAPCTFWQH